jgi:hypothetical protein
MVSYYPSASSSGPNELIIPVPCHGQAGRSWIGLDGFTRECVSYWLGGPCSVRLSGLRRVFVAPRRNSRGIRERRRRWLWACRLVYNCTQA